MKIYKQIQPIDYVFQFTFFSFTRKVVIKDFYSIFYVLYCSFDIFSHNGNEDDDIVSRNDILVGTIFRRLMMKQNVFHICLQPGRNRSSKDIFRSFELKWKNYFFLWFDSHHPKPNIFRASIDDCFIVLCRKVFWNFHFLCWYFSNLILYPVPFLRKKHDFF